MEHLTGPNGRYVFPKGTIFDPKFTFAAVYASKCRQLTFLDSVLESLSTFWEGQLIKWGDFNVSPDSQVHTSSGHSTHLFAFLKHFRKSLQAHHLIDCWRLLQPTGRDYSYFSATHNVYTRIDLLVMDQLTLDSLSGASIGSIMILDHAPVSISLHPVSLDLRTWTWRLNESIPDDAVAQKHVSDTIFLYFAENQTGEVGMGSVWEGHKAMVRGELISQGSRLKKARKGELQTLLSKIRLAELTHKRCLTPELATELQSLQQELANLLVVRIQARLRHVYHRFFEFGNKCGRLLARALKCQCASGHVHKLTIAAGPSAVHSSKIANAFREYYAQLYHLPDTLPGYVEPQKVERILQYLEEATLRSSLPRLATSSLSPWWKLWQLLKIFLMGRALALMATRTCIIGSFNHYSLTLYVPTSMPSGTVMPREALMAVMTLQ